MGADFTGEEMLYWPQYKAWYMPFWEKVYRGYKTRKDAEKAIKKHKKMRKQEGTIVS